MKIFNKVNKIYKKEIEKLALIETIALSVDNILYIEQLFYVTIAIKMTDLDLDYFVENNGDSVKFTDAYQYMVDNKLEKKVRASVGCNEFDKMLNMAYKRYEDAKSILPSEEELENTMKTIEKFGGGEVGKDKR